MYRDTLISVEIKAWRIDLEEVSTHDVGTGYPYHKRKCVQAHCEDDQIM